jgi:hypothetical protein
MDEDRIKAKADELKCKWHRLELETLKPCKFTDEQWRVLARYCLDPNDKEALRGLPIKLADFTSEARKTALEFAAQRKGVVQDALYEYRLTPEFRKLAHQIDNDFRKIAKALFDRSIDPTETQIDVGMWESPLKGELHIDMFEDDSLSFLTGRIGLPCEYIDGIKAEGRRGEFIDETPVEKLRADGMFTLAEDGGVYLFVADRLDAPNKRGTPHWSRPFDKLMASLLAALAC